MRLITVMTMVSGAIFVVTLSICAQKTLMFDSDGRQLTDNEFVDIRLANPGYPDATIQTLRADGTVEFRLQKIGQEGMPAPAFNIKTLDGKHISSDDLKGKVVVLNFWFIGCPACIREQPWLNTLKSHFPGGDVIFIAATEDAGGEVKKYLAAQPFSYVQAADAKAIIDAFVSHAYPRNIVIGRDGRIVYWRTVVHAWDKFEGIIGTELAK